MTVTGSWTWTAETVATHKVTYSWEDAPTGTYAQTLPDDITGLVNGQGYSVDTKFTAGYKVQSQDAYGNNNGYWTFSGWTDPNSGTMGDADVTVTGSWTWTAETVATYSVIYQYEGTVPTDATELPNVQTFVKGQPVTVAREASAIGYTFSGWSTTDAIVSDGEFTMPAKNVVLKGSFSANQYAYTIEYYYDGELDSNKTESLTATYQDVITTFPDKSGDGFAIDQIEGSPMTIGVDESKNVIKVYYAADNWNDQDDSPTGGDGIPDKYQVLINYVSADTNQGTVSPTQEVVTLFAKDDNSGEWKFDADAKANGSTATAKSGYKFVNWTNAEGAEVSTEAKYVPGVTQNMANTTYTFTASFAKKSTPHNPPVAPKLNKADHYAYVVGYPDGTVQPQGAITRAEVATIFFRLLSDETRDQYWTKSNGYTDVKAGDWFNNAVSTLSNAGIINGYPDGTFRPNAPITRAEMAKVIAMFAELNKDSEGFKDIAGHWAEAYIKLAAGNGWIAGYPDGTFRPNQDITRAETMTMINRVLERVPSTEKHLLAYEVMLTFPDNQPGDWYYIAVQEATNSHTYERYATEKNGDEQWIKLIDNYDWTKLEF